MTVWGQSFDRCPKAWLRDEAPSARENLEDWGMLQQHGIMLCGGGLLDQPARYVDAMRTIDVEIGRSREIARAAEAARKGKAG